MHKVWWLSLIASSVLLGEDRVEVIGQSSDANGSLAHVKGSPVVVYQDQMLSADELTYDHNTSIVEATGSVNMFKGGQYHGISEYTKLNLLDDTRYSKPYYMFDQVSGSWISTEEAQGCKNEIDLASGAISGCSSTDPLWKIRFSSADYDTEAMWVNMYNARLEVEDVPVFYLPYFGYPTDTTRRSGLLIPTYGWSNGEGFYYQQPIYFAPQNWWDLELRPQIRTSRGSGIYADFRFVDSASSKGSIRIGTFNEQGEYAQKHHLAHQKHYGYDVNYENSAPLKEWFGLDLQGQSGVFVKGSWMNDVDYINLLHIDQTRNVTANQVMSRINAFYNTEDQYFGAYFKHYQYLNSNTNGQTIQTLPTLHYHRYLESFFQDHMLLNTDMTATNFYRPDGKRAVEGNINVPLMFQTSLFDDNIDASYTANAKGKAIGFYGNTRTDETGSDYAPGYYAQLDHTVALSSTLIRPYESVTHVLSPFASYTSAGSRYYDGYYQTYHGSCNVTGTYAGYPCEFYTLSEPSDTLALGLNNYLFKKGRQVVADRLSQNFRYDDQGSYYGELQNELEWQVAKAVYYYNQTAFNHDRNRVTKEQNTLRYNDDAVTANLSHYYTDQLRNNVTTYTSYWTADATYRYNQHYRYFALVAYDYRNSLLKRGEIGFLYSQRCLDFGLKLVQNRQPILTSTTTGNSLSDTYLFITIILKPIGGSEFNYKFTNN